MKIFPIYMEHVFFPTMKDNDYITEIHHINKNGKDGGVVYSEMKAIDMAQNGIEFRAMTEFLYPAPDGKNKSSYAWNSGGAAANIRDSLTIEKLRAYHQKFYVPENMVSY